MDSTEAANQANIRTARLTAWILILTAVLAVVGIVTLGLLLYPPIPSQAPPASQEGASVVKPLVIVLSSSLALAAVSLLVAAFRLLRHKRLTTELATVKAELATARKDGAEWKRKYWKEHNENTPIRTQNENYAGQLAKAKAQGEGLTAEITGLNEIIEGLQGDIQERDNSVEGRRAENTALEERLTGMEAEKKTLTRDLKEADQKRQEWENRFHSVDDAAGLVRADLENRKLELLTANIQLRSLETDLADAQRAAETSYGRFNEAENTAKTIYAQFQESQGQLADLAWLRIIAEEQAKNISEYVKVIAVKPGSLILNKSPWLITIGFMVRNESVFDVTIDPKQINGRLYFQDAPLHDPSSQITDTIREPLSLRPMKQDMLTLKQPLLRSEAETIDDTNDDNARFWLGNLSIPISVSNCAITVEARNLRIGIDEHVYLKDFSPTGLSFDDGEPLTHQEVVQKIDTLPPRERTNAYKAAWRIYEKALVDQHYAEQDKDPEEPDENPLKRNTK